MSSLDQQAGFEAQLRDLEAAGCTKLFQEQVSSVGIRPQLDAAQDYVREGDTLVVTKLDRLARSTAHLLQIVETIEAKGAALRILDLDLNTSTPTGRLMLTLLGGIAEFERSLMLERQREGIAKAKAAQVQSLQAEGVGPSEIARRLGIGRSSVYRMLGSAV